MESNIKILPLIPLRGITIFPYMVLHFDVGREKSAVALENAMLNGQEIFLVSQKDPKIEEPEKEDIFDIGTICSVKQILKLPGDTVRVLVEGEHRGKIENYIDGEGFFKAEIRILEDKESIKDNKSEALIRTVKESFNQYIKLSGTVPAEALVSLEDLDEQGRLADIVSSYLLLKQEKKQELLEAYDVSERLNNILLILVSEIDILKIERKIGTKVKNKIDKMQKDYYLREQVKAIQEELGEDDEDKKEMNK